MQSGSHVKCVEDVNESALFIAAMRGWKEVPVKDEEFIVDEVVPCVCGKHANLKLVNLEGHWHERYFVELMPPMDIEALVEESICEPVEVGQSLGFAYKHERI